MWHFTTWLDLLDHWQTGIAGFLAFAAGFGTVVATMIIARRQIATAQKQIETTVQLERQRDTLRERDRTERAEVVAFRLSGWLREVGSQIQKKSEVYDQLVWDGLPQPHQIVAQWKLNMAPGIESVMSDLHYLEPTPETSRRRDVSPKAPPPAKADKRARR
jgi:hypothetical protein